MNIIKPAVLFLVATIVTSCGKTGKITPPGPKSEVIFPGEYPSKQSCGCDETDKTKKQNN